MISADKNHYIVAGSRPWSRMLFTKYVKGLPGRWSFASTSDELSFLLTQHPQTLHIFFLHWSNRVPDYWVEKYECVCFHMTDLPYGRGGSPLQNLIERGHRETMLTALRMVHQMDAGPVYIKRPLSLEGNAEEIYLRAGRLSFDMIFDIISNQILPENQTGEPINFKRRTPEQSKIPVDLPDLMRLHDFIRMLDAEGYPHAFIDYGGFRIHLRRAALYDGQIVADVKITLSPT
jgi:methionyl-tRNA formyltransferase